MPNPSRRAIIAALSKHDLSEPVAQSVRQIGAAVRQLTIQEPKEFGALIDAATGKQLSSIVAGTATRLDVSHLLNRMLPGHRYVCIHAHPEDDSFSPHDVALVLRFHAVCVISAVGRHGTWYILSIDPDRTPASPQTMLETFNAERAVVAPKYAELVQSGKMTRREAQGAATHEVWQRIGRALGLRYDRVD
jgi:hypothetical protein